MPARNLPDTIDGVIERLESIIEDSVRDASRLGYFAALYNRVTITVRDGIRRGAFDDNPRMERLDILFANRYLEAYDRYHAGELPSRAWLLAFERSRSDDLNVLQHLMLGMNAHIHLDLGIAAARTCPGDEICTLEGDFHRINSILASLVPEVERELDELSPVFLELTTITEKVQQKALNFSMAVAREDAWKFARHLAPLPLTDQASSIAVRDGHTVMLGEALEQRGPIARWMHARERKDIAANVTALARGEFDHGILPPS